MIHYHGTPLTPRPRLLELVGRNFCVSFAAPGDLECCHRIGQSVMLDNGAFSIWRAGRGDVDVEAYAEWVTPWLDYRTTWCVIPDKVDGTEEENDLLLARWSQHRLPWDQCAPVWHMHESLERLRRLCLGYSKVCLGSSGQYAAVGDEKWHRRMREAMDFLCGSGPAPCWLHMLRGLSLCGSEYPFASADSTNIARNHAGNNQGRARSHVVEMADEIDGRQCAARWTRTLPQLEIAA